MKLSWSEIQEFVIRKNPRLELERLEMRGIPELKNFMLMPTSEGSVSKQLYESVWEQFYWVGPAPTGHVVTVNYTNDYPYSPPKIIVNPVLDTHHYFDDETLCVMKYAEWSPDYTAATIILITFRFLEEIVTGRITE